MDFDDHFAVHAADAKRPVDPIRGGFLNLPLKFQHVTVFIWRLRIEQFPRPACRRCRI
jgi:hypothetical protein